MTVVTPAVTAAVTPPVTTVTPSRGQLVPVLLTVTAFGLALVGITMNGSFAIPTVSKRVGVGSSTEPPQYPVVIGPLDPEDGGGFFAVVLDLPGCFSDDRNGAGSPYECAGCHHLLN